MAERVHHTLPVWIDPAARVLILGTMPSPRSRERGMYYGHPQNRFWPTLAKLWQESVPKTPEEARDFARRHHIALWDVLAECDIEGASDSSIREAVPTDLTPILQTAPIRQIFCNGATSYQLYCRHQQKLTGREAVKLPSTSPANAAWSMERLTQAWSVILDALD